MTKQKYFLGKDKIFIFINFIKLCFKVKNGGLYKRDLFLLNKYLV